LFVFVPIKTDAPVRRTPYVNVGLIVLNAMVFLITTPSQDRTPLFEWAARLKEWGVLAPRHLSLYQFFSYQFLHEDFWHIFGNMVFLWVFGNAVNSKMGNVAYLLFYLAAGVFAGVGFAMTSSSPCLGASGAIAGVTTAYLVLYPHSVVSVFCWLFLYIRLLHVQALLLIVLKIIVWDNVLAPSLFSGGYTTVAYSAHLAGYLFGFSLCFLLLMVHALPRDQYDILALIRRYNQRRQFRTMMSDPHAQAQAQFGRVAQPVSVFSGRPIAVPIADDAVLRLRQEIGDRLSRGAYDEAVEKYEALMVRDPTQVLSRRNMLEIAGQLKSMEKYPQAVSAYEKFLGAYPSDSEAPHAQMMLGILYTKYLQQHDRAEILFRECRQRLTDPDLKALTDQWLGAVLAALGKPPLEDGDGVVGSSA